MEQRVKDIAERLFALRDTYGYTVDELAKKLNLSGAEYAKYESGTVDIPVGLLYQISHFYEVDLTELLTGDKANLTTYSLVKAGKGGKLEKGNHYTYKDLAYRYANRKVEPLLVFLSPGDTADSTQNTHESHEFQYCLKGPYKMTLGSKEIIVETGDALYFDARTPHAMTAMGDATVEIIVVVI